jgi:Leucine-rich repeat (LRR) protein
MSNTALYFNDNSSVLSVDVCPNKPLNGIIDVTDFVNLTCISVRNASVDGIVGLKQKNKIELINFSNSTDINPGLKQVSIQEFGIYNKIGLKHLDLSNNAIEGEMTYNLNALPCIQFINVQTNNLTYSIPCLQGYNALLHANFSDNNFNALPESYAPNMTHFDASNNIIHTAIRNLESALCLQQFNVSNNVITDFICTSVPPSLSYFNASNNQFTISAVLRCLQAFATISDDVTGVINLSGKDMPNGTAGTINNVLVQGLSATLVHKGWTVILGEKDSYR